MRDNPEKKEDHEAKDKGPEKDDEVLSHNKARNTRNNG
jgi:hypothetical protein